MRLLFYTATAAFLIIAAVFAFFALQTPEESVSAKVVLSIDSNEAPRTEEVDTVLNELRGQQEERVASEDAFGESRSAPDPILGERPDDLPSQTSSTAPVASVDRADPFARQEPTDPAPETTANIAEETPPAQPETETASAAPTESEPESDEYSTLPGTMLAGIPNDEQPAESAEAQPAPANDAEQPVETQPDPILSELETGPATDAPAEQEIASAERTESPEGSDIDTPVTQAPVSETQVNVNDPFISATPTADSPQPETEVAEATNVEEPQSETIETETAEQDPSPDQAEQQLAALRGTTSSEELGRSDSQFDSAPTEPGLSEDRVPAEPADTVPEQQPAASLPETQDQPSQAAETAETQSPEDSAEREQALKKSFDAFLSTLEERQKAGGSVATPLTPPPMPRQRPDDIPAPVKTAAVGWASRQVSTAVDLSSNSNAIRVAIMLRGVGRDEENSSKAVTELPSAVSLAFMPFSGAAQQWARKARELGHEVLIQLPFEPSDYPINNPGPETLLSGTGSEENLTRLRTILSRFEGYSGVTNYLGGKLLQSRDALRPILERLKSDGLIYIGEGNNSHALLREIASEIGLRYGGADIVIDSHPAPDAIKKSLDNLAALARKQGTAIGMGYASRTTIEQLDVWADTLAEKGITLVPVGVLANTPGAS